MVLDREKGGRLMAFMEPEIYEGCYVEVDCEDGSTEFLPWDVWADVGEDALESPSVKAREKGGLLGRLTAPGYLDCTPWTPYNTKEEALADLEETDA